MALTSRITIHQGRRAAGTGESPIRRSGGHFPRRRGQSTRRRRTQSRLPVAASAQTAVPRAHEPSGRGGPKAIQPPTLELELAAGRADRERHAGCSGAASRTGSGDDGTSFDIGGKSMLELGH
ncbi:hypothetical protein NOR_03707 [Metarhizium rileyi]|uniref:Uncharacterized protein n=1 Tax=Metarhizium rileyi (strain RCEF 4871) TaxID=1649241 RepID=A0A162JP73_METRR|nr:hypothetical protein NOR_03707 [Metarhizium rileyi RCEF 4871]TWU74702.1 hypothetical protein ED733_004950 [Metarhizium rileyi]